MATYGELMVQKEILDARIMQVKQKIAQEMQKPQPKAPDAKVA